MAWEWWTKMTPEERDKLAGALEMLSIAKLPAQHMTPKEERAWRNGFVAGAKHMLELLAKPAPESPTKAS